MVSLSFLFIIHRISVIPQYQGKAYAVCLDNRKASYGRKKVFLAIDLHINWDDPSLAEKAAIERMKMGFKNSAENAEMRKFFDNFDRLAVSEPYIWSLFVYHFSHFR